MKIDGSIGRPNQIQRFMHCARCVRERAKERFEVGLTMSGLQVWCVRHNCNVAAIELDEPMAALPPCEWCAKGVPHEH